MFTKIECGECGGDFHQMYPAGAKCSTCGHEVDGSDLLPNMEEGESLTYRDGVLGYVTEVA